MLVPFATDYKDRSVMLSYPEQWRRDFRWIELEPFEAEFDIIDYERGRSAARFIAKDTETGILYPIFLSDMMDLIPHLNHGKTRGVWKAKKRGANYGVRLCK